MNLVNLLNTFRGNLSLELIRFINYTEGLDGHICTMVFWAGR